MQATSPSKKPKSRYLSYRTLFVFIGIGSLLIFGGMYYVMQLENHMAKSDSGLVATAERVVADMSLSHLWLEEKLVGDAFIKDEKIFQKLDEVQQSLIHIQDIGEHSHLFENQAEMLVFQERHKKLTDLFNSIKSFTQQRLIQGESAAAGSSLDHQYDIVFEAFTSQINVIKHDLQTSLIKHRNNLSNTQKTLFLLMLLIIIILVVAVRQSTRKQQIFFEHSIISEKEKAQSQQHNQAILEHVPDAIITIDYHGKVISWNKRAQLLLGWSMDEAIGQTVIDLIIPKRLHEMYSTSLQRYYEKKNRAEVIGKWDETSVLNKHGEEVPVELSATHHDTGTERYYIVFIRDISALLETQTRLKKRTELLNEAQKIANLGSCEFNISAESFDWSDQMYRILELDEQTTEPSLETLRAAIHPSDREKVEYAYTCSLQSKEPYEVEHRLLMPDGRIKYVIEHCESFFDDQGEAIRSIGTLQDITSMVEINQEKDDVRAKMEHVQRLESLGVLAGGIAHDFNNILTAIMGNAGLAEGKLPHTSSARDYLHNITKASQKAADLCKQMLAYSGKGRFIIKPIVLSELVEEMGQLLKVTLPKNVVLRLELSSQIPAVDADITQMQQVIMNLVINAAEAIGENSGSISISTGMVLIDDEYLSSIFMEDSITVGRYIYLEVSDTGCGMDKETQQHIFEPFYTTKFTGRGLGMAAILGIVRGHQGAIKVYSEERKGSTFKVFFPCSEQKPTSLKHVVPKTLPQQAEGCVLVVDDEDTIRAVASSILEDRGLKVLTACDGLQAVEIFQDHHDDINIVLLDMTMPRMGGEDAYTELCRIDPHVKVILSSGYNEQDATNRFAGKGLAGFLQKPYTSEQLASKITEIFNRT